MTTRASERWLHDKDVLFLKHDPESFIGLVLGRHLYTVPCGPDGWELTVNDIRPGEVIGETALIQLNRHETSAYTFGAASVLILRQRHFAPLIADTEFFNRVPALLCSCLREASGFVERVCLHRLESRLARHLLTNLASEQPEGACTTLPINQSVLAAMLNASRPKLNAQLQIWKREGLISCRNDQILISDLGRLRHKAELPAVPLSPRQQPRPPPASQTARRHE